jgi:hypothetical protein
MAIPEMELVCNDTGRSLRGERTAFLTSCNHIFWCVLARTDS